jgi:hypothetical protein
MSQDLHTVNVTIPLGAGTSTAGTSNVLALALPGTSYGGGITLRQVYFGSNKAIAAGSAPCFRLITQTSTGGTIGTIVSSGSAALSAGTPVVGTITAASAYIPGTVAFVSVQFGINALAAVDTYLSAVIQYSVGRGSA